MKLIRLRTSMQKTFDGLKSSSKVNQNILWVVRAAQQGPPKMIRLCRRIIYGRLNKIILNSLSTYTIGTAQYLSYHTISILSIIWNENSKLIFK